ncbi:MAG TPA: amino acid ABC transporter permease [Firmicutes bacterium]|jgi:polar amino acid transport system permease protein|nr:amino acid ABC transporter permease [Bacillota bacterium]
MGALLVEWQLLLLKLSEGMLVSVEIFTLTLLFSLPLGLFVSFGRMSKNPLLRNVVKIYISIMRGTPLMLQLMVVYFGPFYIFKMSTPDRFVAVIIGFVLNYAAYFAEIYRAGIESMPVGQYEAAKVLGYSKTQTFLKIILPQVIKRILPPVTNEVITLVKDTSLAFVISVSEMFTLAKAIASAQRSVAPYIAAGIFYYVFNFIVAYVMEWVEKKFSYFR